MVKTGTGNGSTPCYSLLSVVLTEQTQGLLIWNDLSNVSGYLIWNDLSNVSGYLRVTSDSGHGMTVTTERLLRRLITLIYAGRDRMVVIRRELPRTKRAGPACRPAA